MGAYEFIKPYPPLGFVIAGLDGRNAPVPSPTGLFHCKAYGDFKPLFLVLGVNGINQCVAFPQCPFTLCAFPFLYSNAKTRDVSQGKAPGKLEPEIFRWQSGVDAEVNEQKTHPPREFGGGRPAQKCQYKNLAGKRTITNPPTYHQRNDKAVPKPRRTLQHIKRATTTVVNVD
jgi:hypothetical protein